MDSLQLGLGKTLYHSSAALLEPVADHRPRITVALSERLLRKKASGVWPERAIQLLQRQTEGRNVQIAENRDVISPHVREMMLDQGFPFYSHLERRGLTAFSRKFNPSLVFVSHHRCHAQAAALMSPFEKALIVVIDGAGTRVGDFASDADEIKNFPPTGLSGSATPHEECSVYTFDAGKLRCVSKRWQVFRESGTDSKKMLSEGLGIFYETAAEYIFNCNRSAGKVMGLAPLASKRSVPLGQRIEFMSDLNWQKAFVSKGREAWENSGRFESFADLAATVQATFEDEMFELLNGLRARFPEYENLILTGGCALNCTFNGKLVRQGTFTEVFVPPFPGDESIGLGAAAELYLREQNWRKLPHEDQHGYFGPVESEPVESRIKEIFGDGKFHIEKPPSISLHVARILADGHIVAWFQGRSESGPRALGNRSLLARPDRKGLKDFLNARIKFREAFRPYGASCTHEKAGEYFEVPNGFNTPYMAFAAITRPEYREALSQVTHVDGTCRFQSVRPGQNRRFHDLIDSFGRLTGLHCLLNTSLNIMGEPIVESPRDARAFLERMCEQSPSPVHGLAIGDFYVTPKGSGA